MPGAIAQQALIEQICAKAGLDLRKREDRSQLFEACGTGTPDGGPVEAQAISMAFLDHGDGYELQPGHELSVKSIKTILGYTESTAGIASILRASLAVQNARIPADLHFHKLSPAIVLFFDGLEVPTTTEAWPDLLGTPSVLVSTASDLVSLLDFLSRNQRFAAAKIDGTPIHNSL